VGRLTRVLVVGGGGREHALAWALARSPQVDLVYVAPGNAGTDNPAARLSNIPIKGDDIAAMLQFARQQDVALTVVGPEAPLALGIVDAFQAAGLRIFGPTQAAAQLEWSKVFAKEFMQAEGIPTANYTVFSDYEAASTHLASHDRPWVVKADGLAAGKGVLICDNATEARAAVKRVLVDREFGAAGERVILEERLSGREVSVLVLTDGQTMKLLPLARDHKRLGDGDSGPNTGGMGAFAPARDVDEALVAEIQRTVLEPTLAGMARRGTPYVGVLYAGLMLTECGPRVLEYNCRLGDPETQAILPLLESDLFTVLEACVQGDLAEIDLRWRDETCVTVVLASAGYPGAYQSGQPITGLDDASTLPGVTVFHAATARRDGQTVTSGGRVLAVSALGPDLPAAHARAYAAVDKVHFKGMRCRRDIGRSSA
jgi:phosphoribosylamine--glycine ligase